MKDRYFVAEKIEEAQVIMDISLPKKIERTIILFADGHYYFFGNDCSITKQDITKDGYKLLYEIKI